MGCRSKVKFLSLSWRKYSSDWDRAIFWKGGTVLSVRSHSLSAFPESILMSHSIPQGAKLTVSCLQKLCLLPKVAGTRSCVQLRRVPPAPAQTAGQTAAAPRADPPGPRVVTAARSPAPGPGDRTAGGRAELLSDERRELQR